MKPPASRPALVVSSAFSERDLDVLLAMMRTGAWVTPAACIRSSLWSMARHLGLDPPIDVFDVTGQPKRTRRARHRRDD